MTEHPAQNDFIKRLRICFGEQLSEASKIVEVNVRNTNGAVRTLFPQVSEYIVIALSKSEYVDWIIPGELLELPDGWADISISTDCLQHCEVWLKVLKNMLRMTKPEGIVILTSTINDDSGHEIIHSDGARTQDTNSYYKDLDVDEIADKIKLGVYFERHGFEVDPVNNALYFWGIRSKAMCGDDGGHSDSIFERLRRSQSQLAQAAAQQAAIRAELKKAGEMLITFKNDAQQSNWLLRMECMNAKAEMTKAKSEAEKARIEATQSMEEAAGARRVAENAKSEIYKLRELVESSNKLLSSITSSTSWKLTKIPRAAIDKIKKCIIPKTGYIPIQDAAISRKDQEENNSNLLEIAQILNKPAYGENVQPIINAPVKSEEYTELQTNPPIDPIVKLIAFYLPQFHPFPENDSWWGKGFTEWYNVGKAFPNFSGHYQPHCPIHLGYYDLRINEILIEQAKLAQDYGIHGFSYYFYWFAGKVLMNLPLQEMLKNKNLNMPFCLTWANENWTRRWDGADNDILISQEHSDEDSLQLIEHLTQYFEDPRYIRIDGRPLLVVYRPGIIPEISRIAILWREYLTGRGFPGLYLISAQTFSILPPIEYNFDASVEFPPHGLLSNIGAINSQLNISNPEFKGQIFSYEEAVTFSISKPEPDFKLFKTAMLSWDNTARKQHNGTIFHGFSLSNYQRWLRHLCTHVCINDKYTKDEKIVFINAWNEWAEGSHLEPDRRFGYGYLQATYDVVSDFDQVMQDS
jgi:SAM-dependent methyltransferase